MVDRIDLGSIGVMPREGSSPSSPTYRITTPLMVISNKIGRLSRGYVVCLKKKEFEAAKPARPNLIVS